MEVSQRWRAAGGEDVWRMLRMGICMLQSVAGAPRRHAGTWTRLPLICRHFEHAGWIPKDRCAGRKVLGRRREELRRRCPTEWKH